MLSNDGLHYTDAARVLWWLPSSSATVCFDVGDDRLSFRSKLVLPHPRLLCEGWHFIVPAGAEKALNLTML